MARNKQKETWYLFLVLLFFVSIAIIGWRWNEHALYQNAYRGKIEENQRWRQSAAPERVEPRPAGFSERDIQKQRGNRYATY